MQRLLAGRVVFSRPPARHFCVSSTDSEEQKEAACSLKEHTYANFQVSYNTVLFCGLKTLLTF